MSVSRKNFLRTVALGAVGVTTTSFTTAAKSTTSKPENHQLTIGLASYTLRKYSLDEVIDIALGLNLKDVAFKSMHLPYESTDEELKFIKDKVKARGLNLYGGGVIYMKSQEDIDTYFKYAKTAGFKMIIGVTTHELLPQIEKKVKETDIKLAIHNHGPEDKIFPSPKSVYDKIKNLDKRIGLCMDLGHTFRLNLDPAEEIKKYQDRLLDVHLKDINEQVAEGKPVEIGRGKMNIPSILKALKEIKYSGVVGIEYEKDGEHAKFGLAESVGYIRAVLDTI